MRAPDHVPVGRWDSIPLRPGVVVELWYVRQDDCMLVTVNDDNNLSFVARVTASGIDFPCGSGWRPAGSDDGPYHVRTLDHVGALAVSVLMHSGTFCGSQAWTDYRASSASPVWGEIASSAIASLSVSSVLYS